MPALYGFDLHRRGTLVLRDGGALTGTEWHPDRRWRPHYRSVSCGSKRLIRSACRAARRSASRRQLAIARKSVGRFERSFRHDYCAARLQHDHQQSAAAAGTGTITIDNLVVQRRHDNGRGFLLAATGTLGGSGFGSNRIYLSQVDGGSVPGSGALIGGWAIANNDSFAVYTPAIGVTAIAAADPARRNTGTDVTLSPSNSANINDGTSRTFGAANPPTPGGSRHGDATLTFGSALGARSRLRSARVHHQYELGGQFRAE